MAAVTVTVVMVVGWSLVLTRGNGHAYGLAGMLARGQSRPSSVRLGSVLRYLPRPSGGLAFAAREAFSRLNPAPSSGPAAVTVAGCGNRTSNGDVRVNQDCTVRRQTDVDIAVNPLNSRNLIAGQNDSSIGWNHCAFDYSLDGGVHWGTGTPPFFERGNHPVARHSIYHDTGTMHTYDAASGPSVAFDSRGNSYFTCTLFDINDGASAIYVARSPSSASGGYYITVPPYSGSGLDRASGVVVEDNSANALPDGERLAADSYPASRFRDRLYVTWTEFLSSPLCADGGTCSSPIYFARSSDGGVTWSKPVEISGNAAKLCFDGNLFDKKRKFHDCDLDEGSRPIVLPNGTIVVLFDNANTLGVNPNNQILAVVSKNGGATWSRPRLVGRDIVDGEPQCNVGDGNGNEECIPGPFIRGNDDPQVAVDQTSGTLYAVWNDYSEGRYAIRLSQSKDGGFTWTELSKPVDAAGMDSYMPAIAVSSTTHQVVVSYYRSGRVKGENNHSGPFRLGAGGVGRQMSTYDLSVAGHAGGPWTTSTLAPSFGAPTGDQTGYNGDYSGLAVVGGVAHPIWADTRNVYRAGRVALSDEDVFTVTKPLG